MLAYGGTNSTDAVYLTNQGIPSGILINTLNKLFTMNFQAFLFRNYPSLLDTNAWKAANAPGFITMIRKMELEPSEIINLRRTLDTLLCVKGFLTQYGGSRIENDVNTFAQNLFLPEKDFWNYVDRFPGIRKKVNLLINFYSRTQLGIYGNNISGKWINNKIGYADTK